jgi:hypothetical protein
MPILDTKERDELIDLIAQAVIDRIEERERVMRVADFVVQRVFQLQAEEAAKKESDKDGKPE